VYTQERVTSDISRRQDYAASEEEALGPFSKCVMPTLCRYRPTKLSFPGAVL